MLRRVFLGLCVASLYPQTPHPFWTPPPLSNIPGGNPGVCNGWSAGVAHQIEFKSATDMTFLVTKRLSMIKENNLAIFLNDLSRIHDDYKYFSCGSLRIYVDQHAK